MALVLDASVTMAWCFDDEAGPYADAVFDRIREDAAFVPAIWSLEVANAVLIGERRQRLTHASSTRFLQVLEALPITVDDAAAVTWGATLAIGRRLDLSAYDASYLELATRQGLPLATQDTRLRAAAARIGVPLVTDTTDAT